MIFLCVAQTIFAIINVVENYYIRGNKVSGIIGLLAFLLLSVTVPLTCWVYSL
jgi:hypothetical protein